jgi:hypothetical protein
MRREPSPLAKLPSQFRTSSRSHLEKAFFMTYLHIANKPYFPLFRRRKAGPLGQDLYWFRPK